MKRPTRAAVAHHEAGHALVGMVSFGNVGAVSIRAEGNILGHAVTERFIWTPELLAAQIAADAPGNMHAFAIAKCHQGIRWALAGHVAESVYTGVPIRRWVRDDDVETAVAYLRAAYPDEASLDLWSIQREARRVRGWLRRYWTHVGAIARALQRRETLTGDDVWAALGALPHPRPPRYPEDREAMRHAPPAK